MRFAFDQSARPPYSTDIPLRRLIAAAAAAVIVGLTIAEASIESRRLFEGLGRPGFVLAAAVAGLFGGAALVRMVAGGVRKPILPWALAAGITYMAVAAVWAAQSIGPRLSGGFSLVWITYAPMESPNRVIGFIVATTFFYWIIQPTRE